MQIPVTRLPEVDQPAAPSVSDLLRQTQGAGPGQGEGSGTGGGPGSGSGTGGGVGSGRGTGVGSDSGGTGRVFPPQPQGIILPPTGAPANLRGVRLTVRFEISERGEVLRLGNSRELKVARARLQAEVLEHLTGSNGLMEMLHPKKNKK